jgi:hypothetical protein
MDGIKSWEKDLRCHREYDTTSRRPSSGAPVKLDRGIELEPQGIEFGQKMSI